MGEAFAKKKKKNLLLVSMWEAFVYIVYIFKCFQYHCWWAKIFTLADTYKVNNWQCYSAWKHGSLFWHLARSRPTVILFPFLAFPLDVVFASWPGQCWWRYYFIMILLALPFHSTTIISMCDSAMAFPLVVVFFSSRPGQCWWRYYFIMILLAPPFHSATIKYRCDSAMAFPLVVVFFSSWPGQCWQMFYIILLSGPLMDFDNIYTLGPGIPILCSFCFSAGPTLMKVLLYYATLGPSIPLSILKFLTSSAMTFTTPSALPLLLITGRLRLVHEYWEMCHPADPMARGYTCSIMWNWLN